jgi:hypothetical protein
VASKKGHGKGKASNIVVVCPTLTIAEAAERIGCEPAMLWALLHKGELPGVVRLDRYYVREDALAGVLEVLTAPNR